MRLRDIARTPAIIFAFILASTSVADSQQIVDNPRPLRSGQQGWRIEPRPIVDIGGIDNDSLYEFLRIAGIVRLSDGRIAVANGGTNTIRFYDRAGKYLSAGGGTGDGPGEFRQLLGLHVIRGDTLHVTHLKGVVFFSPDGRYVRAGLRRGEPTTGSRYYVWPAAVFADGSHIGTENSILNQRSTRQGRWIDSVTMFRASSDGAKLDSVARFPFMENAHMGALRDKYHVEFSPKLHMAAEGGVIYAAFADRAQITAHSLTGQPLRVIRWAGTRAPVPPALVDEYKQKFLNQQGEDGRPAPPQLRTHWQNMVRDMTFAEEFPAFRSLVVDGGRNLWVQRYDPWMDMPPPPGPVAIRTNPKPTNWEVFDPQGRWITSITLPASFTPTFIGTTEVGGVWRDADDVEHVRFYRIIRP